MTSNRKLTVVLVSGAWHGGWVWRDVVAELRRQGHAVTAPTLTGVGERFQNASDDTGLGTHVVDIVSHIEVEGLDDVTLVGWSYGGMVVAGVAARIPGKIRSVIYLDAFVPEDGKAAVDYFGPGARARVEALAAEGKPIPPLPLEAFGVTDRTIVEFVTPRLTPQPWRTFVEPVQLRPLPETISLAYIFCSGYQPLFARFHEMCKADPRFRTAAIETGHLCMLTDPLETCRLLVEMA